MPDRAGMFAGGEEEGEQGPTPRIVRHSHITTMRVHGFLHNGEAEARPLCLRPFAAPEPIENALAVLRRHTTSLVRDSDPRGAVNRDGDFPACRRMHHAVLDEVPDGI